MEEFAENSLSFCNRQEVCVLRSVLHPRPILIACYLLIVAQAEFVKKFSISGQFLTYSVAHLFQNTRQEL